MSQRNSTNEKLKTKNSSSPSNPNDEQRYCICQKREDELNDDDNNDFMIECDGCNGWFHGKCVDLADRIADDIEKYFCNECSKQQGPSIFKQRKNQHRRDYSDANADNKPTQSGTQDFINKLKRKIFPSCEPVITRLKGNQVTAEYIAKNGFTKPILVANRDGLDMTLPNRTITLAEINELVGHDRFIDIIDCEKQVTYKMSFDDYIEYFESFERNKIYNVLSLEISNTKLGEQVVTPQVVRDLSWATIGVWPIKKQEKQDEEEFDSNENQKKVTWPLQTIASLSKKKRRTISSTDTDQSDDEQFESLDANHFENFERPEVAKYCLMSPQSSYTDFHVDFGGSSVWYSVVRGEKIFYLIEPTDENLQKYADWSGSPNESETFLGDCVTHCYKMHLREENTVFIPPGWIHAVYTVTDSLVFGGNFLQSMGVDMQLRIYELERLAQVPNKFQFPLFETFHWYAAKTFYEELKQCNESDSLIINPITQQACESIIHYMSKWLSADKRYQIRNRSIIPKGINCEKILRDLARELDLAKIRCGSSCVSKPPSNSIIASPIKVVLPMETKQELVHLNNKIKVKCRRLSSETENIKDKDSSVGAGVKLTIKTTLSGCRKPSSNRELTSNINKKKTGRTVSSVKQQKNSNMNDITVKQEESPKVTYTLDLEAKRQRFIEPANIQSNHDESDKDTTTSSNDTNVSLIPRESHTDINEIHDNNELLEGIADGGLASFVKSSAINDDYYHPSKESKIKREHSCSNKKISIKKSKSKSSTEIGKINKITKKIKNEDQTSSNANRKKLLATTTTTTTAIPKSSSSTNNPQGILTNKKRLSSSTPKRLNSKDRLGKILKIANSIKSRGGILT
ncbi:unnamed protein product [Rotaria sp. Silwood1]|nr:unnamed protein product [Rotaria sp. Silwood1]